VKAETFRSGRDFAAWIGLTPLQRTTGRTERLERERRRWRAGLGRFLIVASSALEDEVDGFRRHRYGKTL